METIHSSFPFSTDWLWKPGPLLWLYLLHGLMLIIPVVQIAFLAQNHSRRVLGWLCPVCSLMIFTLIAFAFARITNNLHWIAAPVLLAVLTLTSLGDVGSTIFPKLRVRDLAFAAFSPIVAACYYLLLVLLVEIAGATGAA